MKAYEIRDQEWHHLGHHQGLTIILPKILSSIIHVSRQIYELKMIIKKGEK